MNPHFLRPVCLVSALALSLCDAFPASACTTAVVAASATANGRPLLWKNRDADDHQNQVVYCADGKFAYVGLVNKGDAAGISIWAGVNTEGFAIMNSASYNMEADKDTRGEAAFMKLALQTCSAVPDFQALLEKTNAGGRDVSANFGVIDARGGASYFETGIQAYKRFNADDPLLAPRGFLVRTNYSESADLEKGTGFLRHDRAVALLEGLAGAKKLCAESFLREVSRDTANARIGSYPLSARKKGAPGFAYTADSICRYDTASCTLFEGAGPSDPPALSAMWVILGMPVSGVAVPLWAAAGAVPAELAPSAHSAPLNAAFDQVKGLLYPDTRGDLKKYMDLDALSDPKLGLLAPLLAQEATVFKQVEAATAPWRKAMPPSAEIADLQGGLARQVLEGVNVLLETRRRNGPGPQRAPPAPQTGKVVVSDLGR
jgi:hypothetical protein